jgi:drug/metabolite transporter (DMT)-like permease
VRGDRGELLGFTLAVSSAAAYGASSVVVKLGLGHGAGVLALVAVRLLIATVLLWAVVGTLRIPRRVAPSDARALLAIGTLTMVPWLMSAAAVERLPVGTAGLLLFTYPAWVTAFEILLGRERFSWWKAAAVAVGLVGVALLLGSPGAALDPGGVLFALGAAVSLAGYIVLVAAKMRAAHPLYCSALVTTGGALLCLPLLPFALAADHSMGPDGWALVVLLGILSALGISMFIPAMTKIGPTRTSIASNLQPVVTVVLAATILGEHLRPIQLLGGLLIVVSIGLLPFVRQVEPVPAVVTSAETGGY